MSVPGKDGAWVHTEQRVLLICDRCGQFAGTREADNSREVEQLLYKHLRDKHGGVR